MFTNESYSIKEKVSNQDCKNEKETDTREKKGNKCGEWEVDLGNLVKGSITPPHSMFLFSMFRSDIYIFTQNSKTLAPVFKSIFVFQRQLLNFFFLIFRKIK